MARLIAALGLNPAHQGALFRLRARLTWRQFSREPGRIVGVVLAAAIFLPLAGLAAVGSFLGYNRLPAPWPGQLLGGVLVFLWVTWLLAPLLLFSLNEGMDLTRLLTFPVSRRDLAVSFVLGTLFDFPTYFMLPLFAAIALAWGLTPGLPLVLLALALAYGHMVLTSQLVVTVAGGILRSRRFRDISIILVSLLGTSCWLLQSAIERLTERIDVDREAVLAWRPLEMLQWLPPGAAARAIERLDAGAWGESLLWLAYAAGWLAVIGWVWVRLLGRWLTGEGFLLQRRARPPAAPAARKATRRGLVLPGVPAEVTAIMDKEVRAMWRVPQRRVGLIQLVALPLFFSVFSLVGPGAGETIGPWTLMALPAFAFWMSWLGAQNMLGFEGPGLTQLLVTPVPRQRIFAGKALAFLAVPGAVLAGMGLLLVGLTGRPLALPALVASLGQAAAQIGVASMGSVLFPSAINLEKSGGRRAGTAGGCATGLANVFLLPAVHGLVSLPAVAPLVLALLLQRDWVAWLGAPLALVYGAALAWLGTREAGRLLLRREPEVIAATRLPDEESGR